MATVTDSIAEALDALHAAFRSALPLPPADGHDDGVGVDVLIGPDQDRTAVPRAVTVAAAFDGELDPLTAVREETGAGPSYTDTITVMCSVLVQASAEHPERDFTTWRAQASSILGSIGEALRSTSLRAAVARARLLSDRWFDAYDQTSAVPVAAAVVVDVQIELTVLA